MITSRQADSDAGGDGKRGGEAPPLTYCTNIHPGESWDEMFAAVRRHAPLVKEKIAPEHPFPLGLRLSGRAAAELNRERAMDFRRWCDEEGIYVSSINGFPYGTFHHRPIKEEVYLPDWRSEERLEYTKKLAELLVLWQPEGMRGSISTVPVMFGKSMGDDYTLIKDRIEAALAYLERLAGETGRTILLSLEPEPGCLLETVGEAVDFFARLDPPANLRSHLALCYDCCHQALQFEDPRRSLALLEENEIRIGHVQVSSALQLEGADIARLARYREDCYLHQTVGRRADGSLVRYLDLDQAIAQAPADVEEWRVHFHVPVFLDQTQECRSTRFFLEQVLPLLPRGPVLEVETYTWTILPPELKGGSVTDCLIREIEWVAKTLGRKK